MCHFAASLRCGRILRSALYLWPRQCSFFLTSSHFSGDAFVKTCEADLELLIDREHLEIAENVIRGGVASIFFNRFFKANMRYMKGFNANEKINFGLLIDANILYGGVMEKLLLPLKDSRKIDIPLQQILNTTAESLIGCVSEVELDYPNVLHDNQENFPIAPTDEFFEKTSLVVFKLMFWKQ